MEDKDKNSNFFYVVIALLPIVIVISIFYLEWKKISVQQNNFNEEKILIKVSDKPADEMAYPIKAFNYKLPNTRNRPVKMLFFGDLMFDRHVKERIEANGFEYLFTRLATTTGINFKEYNLVGANLEGAVTDGGVHYPPFLSYDFAFSTSTIVKLKNYSFNFFNLANNHITDQGERGTIETRKNLDDLDFYYVGCRDKAVDKCSTKAITINNKRIGFAGFSMVYGRFNEKKAVSGIRKLASTTDLVIVNIHWGREYEHIMNYTQRTTAHKLIDAGADIIIGHHPHVVQGAELYKGRFIFYSLGNFIFDQYFSRDTQEGLGVELEISENNIKTNLIPFKSRLSQTELMNKKEKEAFFSKYIKWSQVDDETAENIKNGELLMNI